MFLLKQSLKLHNFAYKLASRLSIKDGVHQKHRLMNYKQFFLDNISSKDRVLDIGCGNGFLAFALSQKAKYVLGLDIDKDNIRHAKEEYNRDNLKFVLGDALSYPFREKFDVAVLSNVLEHIQERTVFLSKIESPKLLIRVPLLERSWIVLMKKELGIEYRLDKGHFVEYDLPSFRAELEKAGLSLESYSIRFGEIWACIKKI